MSKPIPSTTLGKTSLHSMRVIKNFRGIGLRFQDTNDDLFVPLQLPPWDQIPVSDEQDHGIPTYDQHVPPHQQPPQYPQHVFDDLPTSAARAVARHFDRHHRRVDQNGRRALQMFDAICLHLGMDDILLSESSKDEDG